MLNIKVDDGCAVVRVETKGLYNIAYELLTGVRAVISGIAEKDKDAGECILKFCQELLPQLVDPELELGSDAVNDIMDKAIEKARKESEKANEKNINELKELIGGDEDLMRILRAILEDDKK